MLVSNCAKYEIKFELTDILSNLYLINLTLT